MLVLPVAKLFYQSLYKVIGNQLLVSLANAFWIAYRNAEAVTIPAAREGQSILEHHFKILQAVEQEMPN